MTEDHEYGQDRVRPDTAGGRALSRTSRVRPLAAVLACGLAIVVAFQVLLVAGAPWGAAAWGGAQPGQLPTSLRVASTFSAAFWLLAMLTVLSRGGITTAPVPYLFSRRATWALTAILGAGALTNAASPSNWERFGWAPFVLVLAVLSLRLARSPIDGPRGSQGLRRRPAGAGAGSVASGGAGVRPPRPSVRERHEFRRLTSGPGQGDRQS